MKSQRLLGIVSLSLLLPLTSGARQECVGGSSQHHNLIEKAERTFHENWSYPGATPIVAGGSAGGAGERTSTTLTSVMVTGDSMQDVVEHYQEKVESVRGAQPTKTTVQDDHATILSIQDDSKDRPVKIWSLVFQEGDSPHQSTTVVLIVSRADGEQRTHIATRFIESSGE